MLTFDTTASAKRFCRKAHGPCTVLVFNKERTKVTAMFLSGFTGNMHWAGTEWFWNQVRGEWQGYYVLTPLDRK